MYGTYMIHHIPDKYDISTKIFPRFYIPLDTPVAIMVIFGRGHHVSYIQLCTVRMYVCMYVCTYVCRVYST